MIEITPTEVKVSYSIGVKCNGNYRDPNGKIVQTYESIDGHFSEAWSFPPDAVTPEGVLEQANKVYADLKTKLDKRAEDFYAEHSFFAEKG